MSELFDMWNVNINRGTEEIDKILTQSKNTDIITYMSEFFNTEEDHKWRVLMQTSKGRKRKLSFYKSKQRKKEEKVKKKFYPQNFVRITYSLSSDNDEELDVEEISTTKIDSSDDNGQSIFLSDTDLDAYQDELQEAGNDENNADASRSRDKFVESCAKEFKESDLLNNLFHKLQRVGLLNDSLTSCAIWNLAIYH